LGLLYWPGPSDSFRSLFIPVGRAVGFPAASSTTPQLSQREIIPRGEV
jgi:hypothetical protein